MFNNMSRSPNKPHQSDPDLSIRMKRKHGDDFSDLLTHFSNDIMEKLNTWKLDIGKEISEVNKNLNNIIKQDLTKLNESSERMNNEISTMRSEFVEVKKYVGTLDTKVNDLQNELSSVQQSAQFISDQHDDLNTRLKSLAGNSGRMDKIEAELNELKIQNRLLNSEINNSEQRDRLLNLEFVGIPEVSGENLEDIILKIANHVGLHLNREDIVHVNRISSRVKLQGRPRVIIAKLKSRLLRDNFLSLAKKNKVTTKHVDGTGDKPIFINEHLTVYNKMLLRKCKEAAKNKLYQYVWVKNGRILLKKDDTSSTFRVSDEEDLKKII